MDDARATGHGRLLLALDADGLKGINDRWGHAAGDAAIRHLGTMIAQAVEPAGWVARWGGDEFVVMTSGDASAREALLADIQATLANSPVVLPTGAQTRIGVSGGVAWSTDATDAMDLIARADRALYQAKRRRQNGVATGSQLRVAEAGI